MNDFRPCVVVPTYDNPATVRKVVERIRRQLPEVVVVDDGSAAEGRAEVEALGRDGLAHVFHRASNGGKGAAVRDGFAHALRLGYTHAIQLDADGQHSIEDIPKFLDVSREKPTALVLGSPRWDASVNKGRLAARQITRFWTHVETLGPVIDDPMCGFRVYPLDTALTVPAGDRMDFDIEIAVRLVWKGVPIVNVPTTVRYLTSAEGGVSHFRMFHDNVRISWLHTRLVFGAVLRVLTWPVRSLRR